MLCGVIYFCIFSYEEMHGNRLHVQFAATLGGALAAAIGGRQTSVLLGAWSSHHASAVAAALWTVRHHG
jgi:hypothetical protein